MMKKVDPFESNHKSAPSILGIEVNKKVKVKFNFALLNPEYDHTQALKKAREEKSFIPYNVQKNIDFAMANSTYDAGKIYEISEEFYEKWSEKTVETYNSLFGAFQGAAIEHIKRPKVPYVIKVDDFGNPVDPMQAKLDLYPVRH